MPSERAEARVISATSGCDARRPTRTRSATTVVEVTVAASTFPARAGGEHRAAAVELDRRQALARGAGDPTQHDRPREVRDEGAVGCRGERACAAPLYE